MRIDEAGDDHGVRVVAFRPALPDLDDLALGEAHEAALDRRSVEGQHPVGAAGPGGHVPTAAVSALAARRSTTTASQIEPSNRAHIGSSSRAVVTGSGPGSPSAITATMK